MFAAILKGLQFTTLFRDELSKVLFADVEWLASLHTEQFKSIWKNIIAASIRKGLPGLSEKISDHILDQMIPRAGEFYYSDMTRRVKIVDYDSKVDVITVDEEYELTINAHDAATKIVYLFSMSGEWPQAIENQPYVINSLFINGLNYSKSIVSKGERGDKEIEISHGIELIGCQQYKVVRNSRRRFCLSSDPLNQMIATRYTDAMALQVENLISDKITYNFVTLSISQETVEKQQLSATTKRWNVNRLIFPGQGLMLVFSKL